MRVCTQTCLKSRKCHSCVCSPLFLSPLTPEKKMAVSVCSRGFPLHSLQSGTAIILHSPGSRLCGLVVWWGELWRHITVGTCLSATDPPPKTGPHGPRGYVLVTLVNLSSSFLLLPPSRITRLRVGGRGGVPLRGPLNTLTPDQTPVVCQHTHTICLFSLSQTHIRGACACCARGGEGLTGAGSSWQQSLSPVGGSDFITPLDVSCLSHTHTVVCLTLLDYGLRLC